MAIQPCTLSIPSRNRSTRLAVGAEGDLGAPDAMSYTITLEEDNGEISNITQSDTTMSAASPPYWDGSIVILRVSKEAFAFTPNRLRVAIHERLRDAGVGGLCP